MSETDDTDVLLLIPPNFFRVPSSGSDDSLLDSSRTVVHKPSSCTAHVIGKLVNQVYSLENRLENLEISTASDISSRGVRSRLKSQDYSESLDSSDRNYSTFPRRRRKRNFSRHRNQHLSPTSLDSVISYGKHIPSLKFKAIEPFKSSESLVDVSPSMDGDLSSIVSTPSKKNDRLLLNEIDEFLTKVETYESPESKYRNHESELSAEDVIKATCDYFTNKLDSKHNVEEVKLPSGRIVPSNILDKYIYLVQSNATNAQVNEQPLLYEKMHHSTDCTKLDVTPKTSDANRDPVESKSPSVRKLNFVEPVKDCQPTSTPKRPTQPSTYLDNFRPSSNKIYDKASKVLEQYKAQNYSRMSQNASECSLPRREDFKEPTRPVDPESNGKFIPESQRPNSKLEIKSCALERSQSYGQKAFDYYKPIVMREGPKLDYFQNKLLDTIDTDLLSLSDLWGERNNGVEKVNSVKLEEERMKREHCESLIQELQKKLLEQQERLAVAIKVDRSKDMAISKLKEAWLRLTSSLDRAEERHRAALEKMTREVDNFKVVADDAQKKTNHFEAELYKALDLAHDYQEKCKQLVSEKKELQQTFEKDLLEKDDVISSKQKDLDLMKENYDSLMRLNKQSTECVKNVDEALEKKEHPRTQVVEAPGEEAPGKEATSDSIPAVPCFQKGKQDETSEKNEHEATRLKVTEMLRKLQTSQDETAIVRQERDMLKEKVNEERARCNILEGQLAEKQNLCSDLLRKCDFIDNEAKYLRKQMELQKNELKTHYQKQLEDAVLSKLQEFQVQLDRAEKQMENENRNKENAIVDTFNKQMNMIEEQHKLEITVMEEKHKEEMKLYRLQLAQSAEKISLLESKLESFRRRRTELASALHYIMQTQWRQALGLLTGSRPVSADLTNNDTGSSAEAHDYVAPRIPPLPLDGGSRRGVTSSHDRSPLLQLEGLSDSELQHYVKLLLNKPAQFNDAPGDSSQKKPSCPKDQSEEPTSDQPDKERKEKGRKTPNLNKPPWKS